MESYLLDDFTLTLEKEGHREFAKVSYPIRYGRFAEIKTLEYLFQFNLNGELKYLQGLRRNWPDPTEWLKRTVGNDWIYYSAGDYKGVYNLFGEYYFPCLSYPSNSLFTENPFEEKAVKSAWRAWDDLREKIKQRITQASSKGSRDFLTRVVENDRIRLQTKAQKLHRLIGGRVTVLPPDSRHVDYDIIPIILADGCLYNCGFCRVKSGQTFALRTRQNVLEQIWNLKKFYGFDLPNYNALFLGHHDALRVDREVIELAATEAYELFEFERSHMKEPRLFLFGSVDSLLGSEEVLFESLNQLPYHIYINVGLESADPETLALLRKPLSVARVNEAFDRITEINRSYERIEITANFVLAGDLPESHFSSLLDLAGNRTDLHYSKGGIYLSPLVKEESNSGERKRDLIRKFNELKTQIHTPTFIYLIQRL